MAEIQFSTAGELAAKIRTLSVTSREVTERLLAHVAADSAVIEVRREAGLRAAAAGSGRESRRINFQPAN
jgi:Asp-tRNA(Asn)/Glu-tRNA(Gln) amidotransferase A subunit family amidase